MIPLVDLKLSKSLAGQIKKAVLGVVDSQTYILGPQVASFEKKFAVYIGTRYGVGVASGTDALRLTLRALKIGQGDRVLTVALTSPFTTLAILEEGAIPIFCDVDEATWTIDVKDAERKIDNKTRAIVPVHLFGNPSDLKSILNFAKIYKLKVIEDACQAHGAKYNAGMIGSFGDAAAFSFYPTKNLGAMGDAGMIVTNNRTIAGMVKTLRHGGQTKRFWHKLAGINSRLDEVQAAILAVKLRHLDWENLKRKRLAARYRKFLNDLPLKFQESFPGAQSVYHILAIRTKKRDQLKKYLLANGVFSDVYYPYPVHQQNAFKNYATSKLPVTEKLMREILGLPLSPNLTVKNQDRVIFLVKKFF